MQRSRCAVVLAAALSALSVACSEEMPGMSDPDAGPAGPCGDTGQASVAGSVAGTRLDGLQRVLYLPDLDGEKALVLSEGKSECNEEPDDLSLIVRLCKAPVVGDIEVVSADDFAGSCGGEQAGAAVLRQDRSDLHNAESGSVDVDEIDTCMNGSLIILFSGGASYSGNFSAVRCPSTTPS